MTLTITWIEKEVIRETVGWGLQDGGYLGQKLRAANRILKKIERLEEAHP